MGKNEERRLILKMLEEGTISTEEADKLMEALEEESGPSSGGESGSALQEPQQQLPELVKGALKSLKGSGFFGFGSAVSYEREVTGSFSDDAGTVDVQLAGRNGRMQLQGWDEDDFLIKIRAKVRGGGKEAARDAAEKFCQLKAEDASLIVDGRTDMPPNTSIALEVYLPENFRYSLDLHTSNGRLSINDLTCTEVEAKTSNGRVACTGVNAEEKMRLVTSNGRVQAKNFSGSIDAQTSNGRIRLEPSLSTTSSDYKARTSNGSIRLALPATEPLSVSFEARTSNGKVKTDLEDLEYEIDDNKGRRRSHVKAKTTGFEQADVQITADLKTSNGSIRLK